MSWKKILAKQGGGYCCYCKRGPLLPAARQANLSFTKDHVNPRVAGGGHTVPCCRQCNHLKGDLSPAEWFWFIDHHPSYWKTFKTHAEVADAVRHERVRRATARSAIIKDQAHG